MKLFRWCLAGLVAAGVGLAPPARAATEVQKQDAINAGLGWLAAQQNPDGSWTYGGGSYNQAATGAAVSALLSQVSSWGSNAAAYRAVVDRGVAYLLQTATVGTVSTRNDGLNICPGGGSCGSAYWYGSGETTYTTGLVAPAIATYATTFGGGAGAVATSSGPLAGATWGQIAQQVTNTFAAGQSTALNGNRQGGWRYFPGTGDSDMSTTQWAIISMIYDRTLGATNPTQTATDLAVWLAAVQDASGVACYQPGTQPCEQSDTGGFLLAKAFLGATTADPSVQNALAWLNSNWTQTASGTWYGNFGHPYAMWSVYKGLETLLGLGDTGTITNLASSCGAPANLPGNPPGAAPCNWWEDYNQWLVANQNGDGSWNGYSYWTGPLATAFNVSILGATVIPIDNNVPEPATLGLFGAALIGLGLGRRRRPA